MISLSHGLIWIASIDSNHRHPFHTEDLRPPYYLGLEVHSSDKGHFTNQHTYTKTVTMVHLHDTTAVDTPLELNVKYQWADGELSVPHIASLLEIVSSWPLLDLLFLMLLTWIDELIHDSTSSLSRSFAISLELPNVKYFCMWIQLLSHFVLWSWFG